MRYMKEEWKRHFKLHNHGMGYCYDCKCKCRGSAVVKQDAGQPSVDGGRAFRIFFVCDEKGHMTEKGYTKKVDFNKIYGVIDNENQCTDFEAEEKWADEELRFLIKHDPSHKYIRDWK